MQITDVNFTTSDYIEVYGPDGEYISRHRVPDEARESAFEHARRTDRPDGEYTYIIRNPETRMSIRLLAPAGGNPTTGDITPPLAPVGVQSSDLAETSVTISWTANGEPDIQDYRVYLSSTSDSAGFSLISTTASTSTGIAGLTASTQYWVYVTARDNSLNESEASTVITFTTDAAQVGGVTGIFVDGTNGNDSWDGTSAVFTSGTTGPKATISAGIAACSVGDSLYLVNNQTYGFATYDLDWNAGATSAQAAELSGCYISGGIPYAWTPESGEVRPIFQGRFRSTNENFSIKGLQIDNTSWALRATDTNNFILQYLEVNRSGTDTSDCIWFNGSTGSKGFWVLDSSFNWSSSLNWAGGNDMIKFNTYHKYIEVARCTFNRAPHDCLSIASGPHYVHDNTFSNVDGAQDEGYRCCSFYASRDATGSADGGEPYGHGLVENNTFLASNAPSDGENIAQVIKMQQQSTIYRFNTFNLRTSGGFTQNEVWQLQTCCQDTNQEHIAPLVSDQRIYNNHIIAENTRRWGGRIRTFQTDGTNQNGTYNPRTELHDNWIFNNHFEGTISDLGEAAFEFQQIASEFHVGNVISQNKVEYNTFTENFTGAFLEDATNGQQTLTQAETNWPSYINNNTLNTTGGSGFGRDLAVTVGSGTSTSLTVNDAGAFRHRIYDVDTGEIYPGDTIIVDSQTATVLDRDLSTNTLTLSTSVTWTAGQAVNIDGYATGYSGIPPLIQEGSSYIPTHYVTAAATGGGNGSNANPWTLTEAMSNAVAGNVIQIGPGVYSGTAGNDQWVFQPNSSGSSGNPIIFFAEYPASANYGSTSLYSELRNTIGGGIGNCFSTNSQDYIIMDGFYIDESQQRPHASNGLAAIIDSNNCEFRRWAVDKVLETREGDNFVSMWLATTDNCLITDCRFEGGGPSSDTSNITCITCYSTTNLTLEYSEFNNGPGGIWFKGGNSATNYGDVRYNKFNEMSHRSVNYGENFTSGASEVSHNLFLKSTTTGKPAAIFISPPATTCGNVDFHHNTIIYAGNSSDDFGQGVFLAGGITSPVTVRDNIFIGASANGLALFNAADYTPVALSPAAWSDYTDIDHNLYYDRGGSERWIFNTESSSFASWQSTADAGSSGFETNSVYEAPSFVNEAGGDYTLSNNGQTALTMSTTGGRVGVDFNTYEIGVRLNPTY